MLKAFTSIVALMIAFLGTKSKAQSLLDYDTLDHTVSISTLRAGSHDPSGSNDYYFVSDMYSLINSSDERNLAFEKRKKIKVELGSFGETAIESLKTWKEPDGKGAQSDKTLKITGNDIRKLTAQSMQEFKAQESEIAIMVEVRMYEKAKKYFFFGEDTMIGRTEYFPISQTKYEKTDDQDLTIQDDKGSHVILRVSYGKKDDKKQAGN